MTLMFVDFQSDANLVQALCTPSPRGKQCLTYNVVHFREEPRDIQSRGMAGNRFDREGGCCKHFFQIPNGFSFIPLHIYSVNTCLFSSVLLPPLSLCLHTGTAHHLGQASLLQ